MSPGTEHTWKQGIGLALVGGGIGLLVGLSTSPVVGIVITSLVGAAAAVTAALAGLGGSVRIPSIRVLPVGALILGVVIGAIGGLWSRTGALLPQYQMKATVARWSKLTGLPTENVARRLLGASENSRARTTATDLLSGEILSVVDTNGVGLPIKVTFTRQDSLRLSRHYDSLANAWRPRE